MSETLSVDKTATNLASVNLALVGQPISIRAETSLTDPDTCKFTVSRSLHPGGPFFFGNKERAAGSPLGERLFALPGVANVLIAEKKGPPGCKLRLTVNLQVSGSASEVSARMLIG